MELELAVGITHRNYAGSSEEKSRHAFGSIWTKSYFATFLESKTVPFPPFLPFYVKHKEMTAIQ